LRTPHNWQSQPLAGQGGLIDLIWNNNYVYLEFSLYFSGPEYHLLNYFIENISDIKFLWNFEIDRAAVRCIVLV